MLITGVLTPHPPGGRRKGKGGEKGKWKRNWEEKMVERKGKGM